MFILKVSNGEMNTMTDEAHPHYEDIPVKVLNSYREVTPGRAKVVSISPRAAFWKGARKSAKSIGTILLLALPFGVMEPFLFMVWGSFLALLLLVVIGPLLHFRLASETRSFVRIEAKCPDCQSEAGLKPYLSTRFEDHFTAICESCGQTLRVETEP